MSLACVDTIYWDDEFNKFFGEYRSDSICSCNDAVMIGKRLIWSIDVMVACGFCRDMASRSCLYYFITVCSCRLVSSSNVDMGQVVCCVGYICLVWRSGSNEKVLGRGK